jgi:hypothetical protein
MKFSTVMDLMALHKQGKITLNKDFLCDMLGNKYRIIRFAYEMGRWAVFLEFPNGNHEPIGDREIKKMGLRLVSNEGVTYEYDL